eukprot:TRINITY_DN10743_c0_g3_i1.p2 TRINITY_DN10743_c0_g3~~TRINITY_DN10743_c0_g3_i1.p2  ORF type:complete len:263 (+),score=10.15 TRINITY_DN10743_c0_g3_i1:3603-4391(+)
MYQVPCKIVFLRCESHKSINRFNCVGNSCHLFQRCSSHRLSRFNICCPIIPFCKQLHFCALYRYPYNHIKMTSNNRTSRAMTRILRHSAVDDGIAIDKDGWVKLSDLLRHRSLQPTTRDQVCAIVENCPKQRFQLDKAQWRIRATQGHSIQLATDDLLQPVTSPGQFPVVVHGTKRKYWPSIKGAGLSTMGRNHVHFATALPGSNNVISGMRGSSEVLIHLDVAKVLAAGIPLFVSQNKVVLCPGDAHGYIRPEFFKRVEFR